MMFVLDCEVTYVSGDIYDERFKVAFVLHHATKEEVGNYWLAPGGKTGGEFLLDLGCEDSFNAVELVNTHNAYARDRSTQRFQVFLRYIII